MTISVPNDADIGIYRGLALIKTEEGYTPDFQVFLTISVLPDTMLRVQIISPGDGEDVIGGENVELKAKVTTKMGAEPKPVSDAEVKAFVGSVKIDMNHQGEGVYTATLNLDYGIYKLTVTAEKKCDTFLFIPTHCYEPSSDSNRFCVVPESATAIKLQESQHKLYLHAYDSEGHHVGVNYNNNETEVLIPGASYFTIEDLTMIILPPNLTEFKYIVDAKHAQKINEQYT